MVRLSPKRDLEGGYVARPVARLAFFVIKERGVVIFVGELRSGFEGSGKIIGPGGRDEFGSRVAFDVDIESIEGDAVYLIVSREGGIQPLVDHPFDDIFEMLTELFVSVT